MPDTATDEGLIAVVKVWGDDLAQIAARLSDIAYDLEVKAGQGVLAAESIGSGGIVTVRSSDLAPHVDWREAEVNCA